MAPGPWDTRREVGPREWEQVENPAACPLLTLRSVVSLMYPGGPPKRKRWRELAEEAAEKGAASPDTRSAALEHPPGGPSTVAGFGPVHSATSYLTPTCDPTLGGLDPLPARSPDGTGQPGPQAGPWPTPIRSRI